MIQKIGPCQNSSYYFENFSASGFVHAGISSLVYLNMTENNKDTFGTEILLKVALNIIIPDHIINFRVSAEEHYHIDYSLPIFYKYKGISQRFVIELCGFSIVPNEVLLKSLRASNRDIYVFLLYYTTDHLLI
jgi:hypothetical protein